MCSWIFPKGPSIFTGDSGFQFLVCPVVSTGLRHSTCLPEITDQEMGFLSTVRSWKCSVKWKCVCETTCDVRGIVLDQRRPLTHSLGRIFLVGERQSSLPRGEPTLLLWVKRNQSLKIYLGEKTVQWRVLAIYSTEELRERRVCF